MTRTRGTMIGSIAIATWSCYGVLVASNSITPPFRSMAVVFTCATLALLILKLIRGEDLLGLLNIPRSTLLLGVIGLFGNNCLYVVALALGGEPVPVNIASLCWPVLMVIIIAIFGVARWTWLDGIAMCFGFGGVCLLALQKGIGSVDWPVVIAIIGALCWALYSALRTSVPAGPRDAITAFVAVSAVACWAITLTIEAGTVPGDEFFRLVLVGIFPVGLSNLAWDIGARYGDPVFLAGLSFMEPLLSTALIAVVLSKPVTAIEFLAMGLVIIAVLCSTLSQRTRRGQAMERIE
jgi:drug/metabolite transporter (DMT)-like permease